MNRFLTDLAVNKKVSASTQNQALSALLFLYRQVLDNPLLRLEELVRAKKPKRLPVVMTRPEVKAVLSHLEGIPELVGLLLYGTGMRLMECLRLRVKDIDFELNQIIIRDGRGQKDRVTIRESGVYMRRTWLKGLVRCFCLMRWPASTQTPNGSGAGNMCFRHPREVETRAAARFGDIISTSRSYNGQSKRPFVGLGSRSR